MVVLLIWETVGDTLRWTPSTPHYNPPPVQLNRVRGRELRPSKSEAAEQSEADDGGRKTRRQCGLKPFQPRDEQTPTERNVEEFLAETPRPKLKSGAREHISPAVSQLTLSRSNPWI
ncbi:hypothetical protein COCON_G00187700 [Conger conger]|uniref:Uncharacterized protein n=1 Tax=Conger conger TaxID=82655 RepID=A0A9Q1D3N3_CONCO|nr:hypothetical protein COCON_G00187700 [Conger conger]